MADPNPSLLAYPDFPEPITAAVLNQLFTPRPEDIRRVWRISSSAQARLGLLCLLKSFPIPGRFPTPEDIPEPIVEYIAKRTGLTEVTLARYPKRTRARHRSEIRRHLGIHRWGGAAETLAIQNIERIVVGRAHLSPNDSGPTPMSKLVTERKWDIALGGMLHGHQTDNEAQRWSMSPNYSDADVKSAELGEASSVGVLWSQLATVDFSSVSRFESPFLCSPERKTAPRHAESRPRCAPSRAGAARTLSSHWAWIGER